MIGYWLARELRGAVPGRPAGSLICQTLVDSGDPAFDSPSKFVGPLYHEKEARDLAGEHGWVMRRDGRPGAGSCLPPSRLNWWSCRSSGS